MEKLSELQEKIVEANPGIEHEKLSGKIFPSRSLHLADVLLAWPDRSWDDRMLLGIVNDWNLHNDCLTAQSEETIDFLHSLLC